jgi:hypothetical protein
MNKFVSQDSVIDHCEILTDDKSLISKYNEIIESNNPLFSTHAFDMGNVETRKLAKYTSLIIN